MGCCCCVCVKESQIGFIESFGKFDKIAPPGVHFICCCTQSLVGTISLRQEQYKIEVETRSKDNVFIKIHLAAHVKIASTASEFNFYQQQRKERNTKFPRGHGEEDILLLDQQSPHPGTVPVDPHKDAGMLYNAYYRLDRPIDQILAYVEEFFRFHGMEYSLDDMFAAKNDMTLELQEILNQKLNPYGWIICNILVLDIDPAEIVKTAMNDIIACEKEKRAQQSRAEADKITKILAAEAEARTRELAGEGIANARKAILNGLQTSVENFQQALPGSDPNQILKTVLMTQYLDTIKEAALTGRNTFVMPSSPAQILNIEEQLRAAIGVPSNPPQQLF
jgi:regulator of protease activity HflC (stomatin/prohibitin superfamily)